MIQSSGKVQLSQEWCRSVFELFYLDYFSSLSPSSLSHVLNFELPIVPLAAMVTARMQGALQVKFVLSPSDALQATILNAACHTVRQESRFLLEDTHTFPVF